jgi:hypothetical protein
MSRINTGWYNRLAAKDKIPGGLSDGEPDSNFDSEELDKGEEVEQEHTGDKSLAKEIAKDHLKEDGKYYTKLDKAGL